MVVDYSVVPLSVQLSSKLVDDYVFPRFPTIAEILSLRKGTTV